MNNAPHDTTIVNIIIQLPTTGNPLDPDDYTFECAGRYVTDPRGDIDFDQPTLGRPITTIFSIDETNSVKGVRFVKSPNKAIYIGAKSKGCPKSPYNGNEFNTLGWDKPRFKLKLWDRNFDGREYIYALNFVRNVNGQTVKLQLDPEIKNGDGHDDKIDEYVKILQKQLYNNAGKSITIDIPIRIKIE